MQIKAFQIYYLLKQKPSLLEGFIPFYNERGTIFLENSVMIKLFNEHQGEDFDWFGVFSHKVRRKLRGQFSFQHCLKCAEKHHSFDILGPRLQHYPWHPLQKKHNPRTLHPPSKKYHGMWEGVDLILKKLKLPNLGNGNHLDLPRNMIYTNSFLIKKHLMRDYIDTLLEPTIELMTHDEEVRNLVSKPSDYQLARPFPKTLAESTGFSYWPHIPFILERLINVYILTYHKKATYVL